MIEREHVGAAPSLTPKSHCHVLPCHVERDCTVDASKFHVKEEANGTLSADLRGRPLEGRQYKVPGYTGVVLESTDNRDEEDTRSLDHTALDRFEHLVVWGNAQPPSDSDPWGATVLELVSATSEIHKA